MHSSSWRLNDDSLSKPLWLLGGNQSWNMLDIILPPKALKNPQIVFSVMLSSIGFCRVRKTLIFLYANKSVDWSEILFKISRCSFGNFCFVEFQFCISQFRFSVFTRLNIVFLSPLPPPVHHITPSFSSNLSSFLLLPFPAAVLLMKLLTIDFF